jgi:hypothetical protein
MVQQLAHTRVTTDSTCSLLVGRRLWRLVGGLLWNLGASQRTERNASKLVRYIIPNFVEDVQQIVITAGAEVTTASAEEIDVTSLPGCAREPLSKVTREEIEGMSLSIDKEKSWRVCCSPFPHAHDSLTYCSTRR